MDDVQRLKEIDTLFFNLAPIKGFSKEHFLNDDEFKQTDSALLMFAVCWNDFKSNLIFWELVTLQEKTLAREISGPMGQISGMKIYLIKTGLSLINEFIKLVEEQQETFESPFLNSLSKI